MIINERLRLEVAQYRAVERAEIVVGDITVLSGVNACGKSTIAHLFHSLINLNRDYERFAINYAWHSVKNAMDMAIIMKDRISRMDKSSVQTSPFDLFEFSDKFEKCLTCDGRREIIDLFLAKLTKQCKEAGQKNLEDVTRFTCSFLRDIEVPFDPNNATINEITHYFQVEMNKACTRFADLMVQRSRRVWDEADYDAVKWVDYSGFVELFENDKCVCRFGDKDIPCLNEILNIDHAFYIESPWRNKLTVTADGKIGIGDGFTAMMYKRDWSPDKDLFAALEGEIAEDPVEEGIDYSQNSMFEHDEWVYARKDGHEPFPLDECATGIKSLSILNFLYTRNYLGNKTLLIIDEPEAHLHPQWILEYAKILVRLNRRLGVRLLITTHSPGMLDAIRRVANVEEVPELRFYLAEEVSAERKYDFVYRDLGRQVEPIFAKFNLASDRTEAYPNDIA